MTTRKPDNLLVGATVSFLDSDALVRMIPNPAYHALGGKTGIITHVQVSPGSGGGTTFSYTVLIDGKPVKDLFDALFAEVSLPADPPDRSQEMLRTLQRIERHLATIAARS